MSVPVSLNLKSSAFSDGFPIPADYTGDGANVSGAFQLIPTRTPPVTLFVFVHPGGLPTNPVPLLRFPSNPLIGGGS